MPRNHDTNPFLGIDLGTTYSAIARWNGQSPESYQVFNPAGETLQSVVYYNPDTKEFLVGKSAYKRGLLNPENMVVGVKRAMDDGCKEIEIGGIKLSPIQISSKILEYLYKDVAKRYPDGEFAGSGTVVTVPYYFKAHQCEQTRKAAELAGIKCLGILQEPIAASLSYSWQIIRANPEKVFNETILVFDLGGGTFDLTLFQLSHSPSKVLFEVMASGGDDRLGGMDFDQELMAFILTRENLSLSGLPTREKRKSEQQILEQVNEAKHTLSVSQSTFITVPNVLPGINIDVDITRNEFEKVVQKYIDKIEAILEKFWETTKTALPSFKCADIDLVILVGGSSKIPKIRELLNDKIPSVKVCANIKPDLCVAEGAAMYAAYLDDRDVFGRELEIRTRTCHDLGIEIAGGRFHSIIKSNRKTPCQQVQSFTTDLDDVTSINIKVFQGSSKLVKDNSFIGELHISGLPSRPKGSLDINVLFKVNEEQQLSVSVDCEGIRKAATLKFT